ncbi:MAG: hypothetical protein KC912_17020 [Proteobacteria bacterium]|nr:hypothetical protein [Pseudomonadota bacterium]
MIRFALTLLLFVGTPAFGAPKLAIAAIDNHTGDATLDGAGHGVAAVLTSKFTKVEAVDVVERERLASLVQEIELGASGLVDPSTAAEAGRILGADYMVFGSLVSARLPALSVTLWVVDVETGKVIASEEVRGEIGERGEEFFVLIDELAFAILDALELRLAARDRLAFGEVDVRELSTVDVYGRALEAMESGESSDAQQLLSRAVTLEPGFTLAEEALTRLSAEVGARRSAWAHEAIEKAHAAWAKLDEVIAPAAQVPNPGPEEFAHLALMARRAQIVGDFETYFELEERRIEQTTAWIEANRPETRRPGDAPSKFSPHNTFSETRRDTLKATGTYGQSDWFFNQILFWPWEIKHQLAETLMLMGERQQALALVVENYQHPGPMRSWSEGPPHPYKTAERWDQWPTAIAFAQQMVRHAELGGDRDMLIRADKELSDALGQAESMREATERYEVVARKLTTSPATVDDLVRLVREEERAISGDLVASGHALRGYRAFLARVDSGYYDQIRSDSSNQRYFRSLAKRWKGVADGIFRSNWYREIKLQHLLTYQEQVPPRDDEEAEKYRTTLESSITSGYRL